MARCWCSLVPTLMHAVRTRVVCSDHPLKDKTEGLVQVGLSYVVKLTMASLDTFLHSP